MLVKTVARFAAGAVYLAAALLVSGGCGGDMEIVAAEKGTNASCTAGQPLYRLSSSEDYVISAVSLLGEDSCDLRPLRMLDRQGKVLGNSGKLNTDVIVPRGAPDFELGFLLQGSINCNVGVLFGQSSQTRAGCSYWLSETALAEVQGDDVINLEIHRLETARQGCAVPLATCSTTYGLQMKRMSTPSQ